MTKQFFIACKCCKLYNGVFAHGRSICLLWPVRQDRQEEKERAVQEQQRLCDLKQAKLVRQAEARRAVAQRRVSQKVFASRTSLCRRKH